MKYAKLLYYALTIGEKMLTCGAEVSRVEDSIVRICTAYGAARVDVFAITSSIVASADFEGKTYTQTRRIKGQGTNFEMLDALNNLSRTICATTPDENYIEDALNEISERKGFSLVVTALGWGLTAGAFAVFFGGTFVDGAISAFIAILLTFFVKFLEKKGINKIYSNLFSSFLITTLAYAFIKLGVDANSDKIIIGNIMLLIPGIALTTAIRDLISGDMIAGILRFCEAILVAGAIAGGYFITVMLFGGAL